MEKKKDGENETVKDREKETRRNRNRSNLLKSLIKQQLHVVREYRATARYTTIQNSFKLYLVPPLKINSSANNILLVCILSAGLQQYDMLRA